MTASAHISQITPLYEKHRYQLVKLSRSILSDQFLAEEIVQEVFLRFITMENCSELQSPIAYLRTMVRNDSIKMLRKRIRENEVLEDYANDEKSTAVGGSTKDPELVSIERSQYRSFRHSLADLPKPMRQAILLYLVEEFTFRQIAEQMNVSLGQAHALVKNGFTECAKKMRSES